MTPHRPLDGRTVVITRPREQAGSLAARLRARGATPLLAPSIELRPAPRRDLERALDEAATGRYEWVVFTSRAGVDPAMVEGAERAEVVGLACEWLFDDSGRGARSGMPRFPPD